MSDTKPLTERLRTDAIFDNTTLGNEAADALEAQALQLDVQAGSIEAVQAANQRLAAEVAEHKENAMRNARIAVSIKAERDALRKYLEEVIQAHPVSTSLRQTDAVIAAREAIAVSAEPEIVANEGMPTGLSNEPEILAEYTGINGVRQWASTGAWLYPGEAIAVISDHFPDAKNMVQTEAQGEAITLQRWGRAENLCLRLLDPMDDGYWTPWHIAQEAIDSLQKKIAFHPQATEPQAVTSCITLAQLVQAMSERDLPPEVTQKIAEQIAGLALSDPATEQFLRRLLAGSGTTDTATPEQKP